ncbi:Uncharacterized protein conserved in archaea [Geoglobus ahangari]|uniref:Uncharacterized protein conserved in archaea n=1 Tax=Geoglobus ahangari TaxID=113653 RepID=A0A0F7IDF5_9EURY|nr:hypothetical protein [Geoglobus ahangari]AKG91458.1 Uncharacterized protein conserved in archaea [Geoglobus ahangari]NOY11599.1 hypothetical protein [Archaeoglobi archaeon]
MKPKVLVIVSSGRAEKEKAMTGLMYAVNATKHGWADVKLILFGPVEELVAEGDPDILTMLEMFAREKGEAPLACKRIAEMKGYEDRMGQSVRLEYVGKIVSELIADGYTPLVF